MKTYILTLLQLIFLNIYTLHSQSFETCTPNDVSISIKLNKKEYYPFESISALIIVKNISDKKQQIGPIDLFSRNLRYQIIKDNIITDKYSLWYNIQSGGWFLTQKSYTKPNEFKTYQFVVNHFFNSNTPANYSIEVGFPKLGYTEDSLVSIVDYKTEKVSYTIKDVNQADSIPLVLFSNSFEKVMNWNYNRLNQIERDSISHKFNRIIHDYTNSYLVEPSEFYIAFFYMQKFFLSSLKADIEKSINYFSNFQKKYPQSDLYNLAEKYRKECLSVVMQLNNH